MKTLLLIILLYPLQLLSTAAQVQQTWVKRYSLDTSRTNQATALALSSDGNVIVAGSSAGTNGDLDYLVIKYSPSAQQQWLARYDSPTNLNDQLRGISLDSNGNIFVTGTSKTIKLGTGGGILWTAPYGGRAVGTDAAGNAYVTGFSELDYATVKLDPGGTNLWLRTYTYLTYTNAPDIAELIAVGSNGPIAVSGWETHALYSGGYSDRWVRTVTYDTAGNQLWTGSTVNHLGLGYWEEPVSVLVDGGGRVLVADNITRERCYDTTLYDTSGNQIWNWYLDYDGPAYVGYGAMMIADSADNAYLTGTRYVGDVCATVKITNGHTAWISTYHGPGAGTNQGTAIAMDAAGNIYAAAFSPGTNSGNDIATIKYDNNGNQLWVQRYDGPAHGDDIPTGIVVDNQGGVYVTGYSATTNGGTEFVTIKYSEQYVKKLNDGSIQLQFFGPPGQTSAFYGSTDFLTWSNLGSAVADTNGVVQFTDTNAPLFNYRFYKRTVLP